MLNTNILIKPVLSEKSMEQLKAGEYIFEVAPTASKGQIRRTVEDLFGVEVDRVRTVGIAGKRRSRSAGRFKKAGSRRKKAFVTLKKGKIEGWFGEG